MIKSYDAMGLTNLRDDAKRVLAKNSSEIQNSTGRPAKSWWQFW